MKCELFSECPFTDCGSEAETYCTGNPFLCARRRVAVTVGGDAVPSNLLPGQFGRVLDIVFNNAGETQVA
jgi:hypothetical protein